MGQAAERLRVEQLGGEVLRRCRQRRLADRGVEPAEGGARREEDPGRGEPVAAGVAALPDALTVAGGQRRRERDAPQGAAHVAFGVRAEQEDRCGVGQQPESGLQGRGRRTVRHGAPRDVEQVARVLDSAGQERRTTGARPRGDEDLPRPTDPGIAAAAGAPDEQSPTPGLRDGTLDRRPELRIEVGGGERLVAPRAGLFEGEPEASPRGRAPHRQPADVPFGGAGVTRHRPEPRGADVRPTRHAGGGHAPTLTREACGRRARSRRGYEFG